MSQSLQPLGTPKSHTQKQCSCNPRPDAAYAAHRSKPKLREGPGSGASRDRTGPREWSLWFGPLRGVW